MRVWRLPWRAKSWQVAAAVVVAALGLRGWQLGANPPSLYWDEVALAYDAWSIATTGRDWHAQAWPIVAFTSYGDYKPSGYFYALAPLIKLFGPHDWVVRLPSVIAGLVVVIATAALTARLFPGRRLGRVPLWLIALVLAALNPALIHLSRAAWETNLATALLLVGIVLLYPSDDDRHTGWLDWRFLGGEIFLLLSFYTYHSLRVVAPLLGLYLGIWRWWRMWRAQPARGWRTGAVALVIAVVAVWPVWRDWQDGSLTNRFQTTTIFYDPALIAASNQCRAVGDETGWARWWCHRYYFFGREIVTNFFSHFNFDYLFVHGDSNARHATQLFGVFYPFEVVPLLAALVFVSYHWRRYRRQFCLLLFWLVVGIAPASVTDATPHLLRTLTVVPLAVIMVALGWDYLFGSYSPFGIVRSFWKVLAGVMVSLAYGGCCCWWLFYSYAYYPRAFASWWQDGYAAAVDELGVWQARYPELPVYFTRQLGRPALYYLWYRSIAPVQVQMVVGAQKYDQGELLTYAPDNIEFGTGWREQEQLFVLTPDEYELLASTPEATLIRDHAERPVLWVGYYQPASGIESSDD